MMLNALGHLSVLIIFDLSATFSYLLLLNMGLAASFENPKRKTTRTFKMLFYFYSTYQHSTQE